MGLFDKLRNKNVNENVGGTVGSNQLLDTKKAEAVQLLDLRKNTLNLCLDKAGLTGQIARVGVAMDYSGSMRDEFANGLVQDTVARLLPIALKFDDNGELDFWLFENSYRRLDGVTINNFYNYVEDKILSQRYRMGGTEFAPVMTDIMKKYMKEEPSSTPTFIIFITDGENSDKTATNNLIMESAKHNIFWQFVGLDSNGDVEFNYLRRLDDLKGRVVDNTSFIKMTDVRNIADDRLYTDLLGEYPKWLVDAKNNGIIR